MNHAEQDRNSIRRLPARFGAVAAVLLCLGLLAAVPARANFEQVANFAGTAGELRPNTQQGETEWPEEVQLGGLSSMAVNYTGAGGVPAGTIYAAVQVPDGTESMYVVRYNPDGSFSESWSFEGTPGGAPEHRCGPEGDPGEPTCAPNSSEGSHPHAVDVDEATGDVYLYNPWTTLVGQNVVHVFSADGSTLLGEFGELAPFGESVAASPGKVHSFGAQEDNMAVNAGGEVYVFDQETSGSQYHRLMKFEPQSPGDYEHYVYAGQSQDLRGGFAGETRRPELPAFDAAGDLFVAEEEGHIEKLDPSQPGAPALCEFVFTKGGVQALAVDPLSDELFFFTYKEQGTIHRLGGECVEGKLHEVGKIKASPNRTQISGLAFDPLRAYEAGRPAGVLYAGAPGYSGGKEDKSTGEWLVESSIGYIFSQPPEIPPTVKDESFSRVTASTAELSAQVNPQGSASRYTFQYETEAAYQANPEGERFAGAPESPPGGAEAGEDNEAVAVAASLRGLLPDTAYRFRAVATNHCSVPHPEKLCETDGEALALRTFPTEAPGLADRRAYELVSPPAKQAGQVLPADWSIWSCPQEFTCKPGEFLRHFPMQSAPDGEAVVYEGTAFASEAANLNENQYIARRDPKAGWQTVDLTPLRLYSQPAQGYGAFSPDLARAVLTQLGPALNSEAPGEYKDLYTQPTAEPFALSSLLDSAPPNRSERGSNQLAIRYAGASEDLSRVFFEANDALTPETAFAPEATDGGAGQFNLYEWHEGALALVNVLPGNATSALNASFGGQPTGAPGSEPHFLTHAISADGRRVFFSDASGQVYVREDGESTREVSSEGTPDPGKFVVAAKNGAAVLLLNGHLHYLEGEEATVDLTQGKGGFLGVVGEAEDLSQVYFVDDEVLDEAPNEAGEEAEEGKDNLYAWAQGEGTRFVARLLPKDNLANLGSGTRGDWRTPGERTAEASPAGRYLAFSSLAPLSGYDNAVQCGPYGPEGARLNEPCPEVFLYDSATEKLSCASCNRSGEAPLGWSTLRLIQGAPPSLPQPRYLTDQGRLYFDSEDSLVPADSNEGVEDVYQYEPGGMGSCVRQGGCVSLISAGTGTVDSNLVAIDPSGRNVFFTTRDQLSLRDHDDVFDLYDAREGGGIPIETEVSRAECQGEACQAPVYAPNDPTPGSSSFEGPGNPRQAKAKKHKKRHRKKHHRHAHKRHAKQKRHAKPNHGGAK